MWVTEHRLGSNKGEGNRRLPEGVWTTRLNVESILPFYMKSSRWQQSRCCCSWIVRGAAEHGDYCWAPSTISIAGVHVAGPVRQDFKWDDTTGSGTACLFTLMRMCRNWLGPALERRDGMQSFARLEWCFHFSRIPRQTAPSQNCISLTTKWGTLAPWRSQKRWRRWLWHAVMSFARTRACASGDGSKSDLMWRVDIVVFLTVFNVARLLLSKKEQHTEMSEVAGCHDKTVECSIVDVSLARGICWLALRWEGA